MGDNSILLQLVPEEKTPVKNRVHLDITVQDIDLAVDQVIGLGGNLVRPKGTYGPDGPRLEWAIMADPFGNEFCIIRDIL